MEAFEMAKGIAEGMNRNGNQPEIIPTVNLIKTLMRFDNNFEVSCEIAGKKEILYSGNDVTRANMIQGYAQKTLSTEKDTRKALREISDYSHNTLKNSLPKRR